MPERTSSEPPPWGPLAPPQPEPAYSLNRGERDGFDTSRHLARARQQADERGLDDVLIVDVDAHHYEQESWPDIARRLDDPVLRAQAELGIAGSTGGVGSPLTFSAPRQQNVAGRIRRYQLRQSEETAGDLPRDAAIALREMDAMSIDYQIVFPTPMLELGMHTDPYIEVQLSRAYSRWFTETVLPASDRIKCLVYLPFNDPEASVAAIEEFADRPGVVGFMVTSTRYRAVHSNEYMKVYAMLEERGLPLGFHASVHQSDRWFEGMSSFLSAHALGFVFPNMIHLTNMVVNGIPERFPGLKVIWIESGLAWVPFLMQRLDSEYMMRSSEAPLLRRRPSEYMREHFWYSSQPLELEHPAALAVTLDMINAETQLVFSSDYPHWDFNLPRAIWDLPFLSAQTRKRILGLNAAELFGLPTTPIVAGAHSLQESSR